MKQICRMITTLKAKKQTFKHFSYVMNFHLMLFCHEYCETALISNIKNKTKYKSKNNLSKNFKRLRFYNYQIHFEISEITLQFRNAMFFFF